MGSEESTREEAAEMRMLRRTVINIDLASKNVNDEESVYTVNFTVYVVYARIISS